MVGFGADLCRKHENMGITVANAFFGILDTGAHFALGALDALGALGALCCCGWGGLPGWALGCFTLSALGACGLGCCCLGCCGLAGCLSIVLAFYIQNIVFP